MRGEYGRNEWRGGGSPRALVGNAQDGQTTAMAVVAKAVLFGVGGWAAENLLYGPRYSAMWHGSHVPFLPVYAAGGIAVLAIAPHLSGIPMIGRGAVYAAMLGSLEYVGCHIDRKIMNSRSWDYGKSDGIAEATQGCVDWKHSLMWGSLGILAEQVG